MKKGLKPHIVFDSHGAVFAIATGSDFCTEHECGSAALQKSLCGTVPEREPKRSLLDKIKAFFGKEKMPVSEAGLIARLREGKPVTYPSLAARKRLTHNLDQLVFLTGKENGTPVAVFGFGPNLTLSYHALRFNRDTETVNGCWDERGFAIKVRGEALVDKMAEFARLVRNGDGMFAGTFMRYDGNTELSGVVLALMPGLKPEHHAAMAEAQTKWEADMRLKARSQLDRLQQMSRTASPAQDHVYLPGHIWPVWKDRQVDGDVRYALNPGYGVKAQYWGPYTFDQLHDWMLAEKKPALVPEPEEV